MKAIFASLILSLLPGIALVNGSPISVIAPPLPPPPACLGSAGTPRGSLIGPLCNPIVPNAALPAGALQKRQSTSEKANAVHLLCKVLDLLPFSQGSKICKKADPNDPATTLNELCQTKEIAGSSLCTELESGSASGTQA